MDKKPFGEILKEVRIKNGDTFRSLAEKIDISFSYIDKVEKGLRPINKEMFSNLLRVYPFDKKRLIEAYTLEVFPENAIKELKLLKDTNDYEYIYEFLFNNLTDIEKKNLLKNMFERLEVELFKKGTYENNKEKLNIIKSKIDNL
ncbi:helix-turn-helix domain-containing protein [Fusobacterium nucleatum]|uniref:helix-turn-helix domain-containing protein n=1 Tax=Fusobacterium nucleatum TaxID=851 RepID=UPI00235EA4C9|nr:helix-turn-helix transcriptional regulator [Fusobacterium nucleatum]WDD89079.1 helix-turn-helix transcriptional regulator [Fusobacterium nucleatum]